MKILFYVAKLTLGGCQINAINLGKALTDNGHKVIFTAPYGPLVERILKNSMTFVPLSSKRTVGPSFKIAHRIAELVSSHSVDVIQAFDPTPLMEAYASQIWHKKPVYGLITAQNTPNFNLPQHQEIALVNQDTIERYKQKWGWNPDNLRLLVARLDCDFYQPELAQVEEVFRGIPIKPDAPIISLVSRIDSDKWPTIELFLSAAHYWKKNREQDLPANFLIVGGGKLFSELQRHIQSLGLDDQVFAIGEKMDIPAIMNASNVVVGMASTCQQGLACGRPVIVVGQKDFSELIEPTNFDYLAGYHFNLHFKSHKKQPEHLCSQYVKILDYPTYASEISKFSRRIACEHFNSQIGAKQLENAYLRLLNNQFVAWTSSSEGYKIFFLSWLSSYRASLFRKISSRWRTF